MAWKAAIQGGLGCMLMFAVSDALAFRCNSYLIEPGQTFYEVRERCGDPLDVQVRTEWRVQSLIQQSCQTYTEPVISPPAVAGKGNVPVPQPMPRMRTVCTPYSVPVTVPVEVEEWYYDDVSVPKLLHFENGRLLFVGDLWNLRHH